jgi:hypothetical protein
MPEPGSPGNEPQTPRTPGSAGSKETAGSGAPTSPTHWAQGLRYFGGAEEKKEGQADVFFVECTGVPVFGSGDIFQTPKEPLVSAFPTGPQAAMVSKRMEQSKKVFEAKSEEDENTAEISRMQEALSAFVKNAAKGYACSFFKDSGERCKAKIFLDKTCEHLIIVPVVEAELPAAKGFIVYLKCEVATITNIYTIKSDGEHCFPEGIVQCLAEGERDSLLMIEHRPKRAGEQRLSMLVRSAEQRKSLMDCLRILSVSKLSDVFLVSCGLKEARREIVMVFKVPGLSFPANQKTISFQSRPIGIKYRRDAETGVTTISQVLQNSLADSLGVRIGWMIMKVGDKIVTGIPFLEVNELIKAYLKRLPEKATSSISTLMSKVYKTT